MRSVFDDLFACAGESLDDCLTLTKLTQLARHYWTDGTGLDLFSDIDQTCAAIAAFGSEKDAIQYRRFAQKSESLFNALDASFMRRQKPSTLSLGVTAGPLNLWRIVSSTPFMSLQRSLSMSFDHPHLRQLFSRYSTYCGSSPFKAPATLMLIAHAERAGVWVLNGGMQALAHELARIAKKNGCTIRTNTTVKNIRCHRGVVSEIVLDDESAIATNAVVYNGDLNYLHQHLLSPENQINRPDSGGSSLSAITLSCLANVNGPTLSHHNVFFGNDYRDEFDALFSRQSITAQPTIYVCAQDNNETNVQSDDTQRLFCLMNAPARPFTDAETDTETQKLMSTLALHGLHVSTLPTERVVATPNTFATRFPGSQGALYGDPTHGWASSFSRADSRTRINGLYLAGGGVHPGAGVPMVSLSGQLAGKRLLSDFGIDTTNEYHG